MIPMPTIKELLDAGYDIIQCTIDGKNIDYEFIDNLFDDGECVSHGQYYLGFVEQEPCTIEHNANSHTIVVRDERMRTLVEHRIQKMLDEMNSNDGSEYERIMVRDRCFTAIWYKSVEPVNK